MNNMSGQGWEVVGKSRQGKSDKKLSKSDRLKLLENAPKVEDILPLSQVKTLYTALDNKENKRPAAPKESPKENDVKRTPKKQVEKKKEVKEKPAIPKTLEQAAKQINVKELATELELSRTRFPDAPLAWLKGLVEYLNNKLDHTNQVVTSKSPDYPLTVLPNDVSFVIETALRDITPATLQHFFEMCIIAMANDLSRGSSSVVGYKVLIQMLAFAKPSIAVASIPKVNITRNSYQNRQPICLAILWAIGQGGFKDPIVGLRVWEEVMLPLIEMKNYTLHVITYLKDILSMFSKTDSLGKEQFFRLLDTVYSPSLALPNHFKQDFITVFNILEDAVFSEKSSKNCSTYFTSLFERLCPTASVELKDQLYKCLIKCLSRDSRCYKEWKDIHLKYVDHSLLLLKHIDVTWSHSQSKINNKLLKEVIRCSVSANKEISVDDKKHRIGKEFDRISEIISKKMAPPSSFPWVKLNCFMLLCICVTVGYDVYSHGSLRSSSIGSLLNDYGVLDHVEHGMGHLYSYYSESYKWTEKNIPPHIEGVTKRAAPYWYQFLDFLNAVIGEIYHLLNLIREAVKRDGPHVIEWVKESSFRLAENVKPFLISILTFLQKVFEACLEWLTNNVFVGSMSPENLAKYSWDAINTTQTYAIQTYDWIVEQVDGFINHKSK